MGHGTRGGALGHTIRTFWPDDDENTMYLDATQIWSLTDIQARINEKWPGVSSDNITISSEEINTDCLGYDAYDPSDWTNFLIITRLPGA